MAARTQPTMPTWTTGQEITSTLLNQITTYTQFWANKPMFRMYQTITTSVATGTLTQVVMDTSDYDTDSGRSGTSPFSYTVPFAGRWRFTGVINWPGNASGYRYTVICQNGAPTNKGSKANSPVNTAANSSVTLETVTIACNVGDVIGVYGLQNSGGSLSTIVSDATQLSYFEGELISFASP